MMPSTPTVRRPQISRTNSWPPSVRVVADGTVARTTTSGSMPSVDAPRSKPLHDNFEEDLEYHPEEHFLSPLTAYEYEDWADDSDDNGEDIEWDAGITDFALFDNDRRQAQQSSDRLPTRWNEFMSRQASALRRAVERNRANSDPHPLTRSMSAEDVPGLTPDHSPNLRDDLDVDSYHGQSAPRPEVPRYLTITVTPAEEDDYRDNEAVESEEDDDLPLSFYVERAKERRRATRKVERPGLKHSRTMSGKVHVWRRPSWHIYPVGEDPEAERTAELGGTRQVQSDDESCARKGRR